MLPSRRSATSCMRWSHWQRPAVRMVLTLPATILGYVDNNQPVVSKTVDAFDSGECSPALGKQHPPFPQSSALSAKSCSPDSPFPAHPGTAACCLHQGLEQKLCLAALEHPPRQLPHYVEPSNEELCEAFKKDPKDFADR